MALEDLQSEYGPTNKRNQKGTGTILGSNITPIENAQFGNPTIGAKTGTTFNNLEDAGELAKQVGAPAALQLLNTIGGLGGSLGGTLNTRRLLESGIKNRTNPFREQFFERVDFRTFNLRHTFMPKNLGEVNQVKKIIDLFKFHMHPELAGEKNLMFLYPSEFDIKYMFEGEENNYFNKSLT